MGSLQEQLAVFSSKSCLPALNRLRLAPNDVPQCTMELNRLFDDLDDVVTKVANTSQTAKLLRTGSIGTSRTQVDYYVRLLAATPTIQTICEVGFNVGHSTALWLVTNPMVQVHTFDLFSRKESLASEALLKQRFPNRLHTYAGNSLHMVPRWVRDNPSIRCDLLHIDGKHSYWNTVLDFVHLLPATSPNAIAIFDDQCDPADCDGPPERRRGSFTETVSSQPTLATCDMVHAGIMSPTDSFYFGPRQFAAFKPNITAIHPLHGLPCSPLCSLNWHTEARNEKWDRGAGLKLSHEQHKMRGSSCTRPTKASAD